MSPPTKELMKLTLEQKIAHGGHPVLRWMMDNIYIRTDPAGNIKADKEKSTEKIDGAVATIMGLDRAIRCGNDSGASVYDSRGILFILQRYMESHGHNCTDEELDGIYKSLKTVNYNSPAADFDARIDAQLNKVAYNRNKVRIQELWKEQSGFDSITLWCANYAVPIQWVVSDEVLPHIIVLKTVQDEKIADNTALHNATQFFETHTVSALKDKAYIASCFISQIGESYRSAFESSGPVLVSRLKTNTKLTSDVYSWANKVGEIRKTVDAY